MLQRAAVILNTGGNADANDWNGDNHDFRQADAEDVGVKDHARNWITLNVLDERLVAATICIGDVDEDLLTVCLRTDRFELATIKCDFDCVLVRAVNDCRDVSRATKGGRRFLAAASAG